MSQSGYRLIDHTADLGVEVRAAGPETLFSQAALAMFDLIVASGSPADDVQDDTISVEGQDWADLMINWLRELLFRWHAKRRVLTAVHIETLSENRLRARVVFESFSFDRHAVVHEIKAATYHQLAVGPCGDSWRARVIFDI